MAILKVRRYQDTNVRAARETIILVAADPALRELARDLLLGAGLSVADASSFEGGVLLEKHYRGADRSENPALGAPFAMPRGGMFSR